MRTGSILHLSDLHLSRAGDEDLGDYKYEIIQRADRIRKITEIRSTLSALHKYLSARGEKLDAVVITGDLTYSYAEDGFKAFQAVLKELGTSLPPN